MSQLEEDFAGQLAQYRLPPAVRQLQFAKEVGRKWAFDFAWPAFMVAVELNGIVAARIAGRQIDIGGHGTVVGQTRDMDKHNAAVLLGWSVLTFTQSHVNSKSKDAISVTQRALALKGWVPSHAA